MENNPILIVLGSYTYPKGSAPANRIHLYCKALREVNGKSMVINLDSPFNSQQEFNYAGRYEGIPFFFSRKTYIRKNNFFTRNIERVSGLFNACAVILKFRKRKNTKILVLFYSILPADEIILYLFLKLLRIKIIRDISEAPNYLILNKKFIRLHSFFLKYFKLKRYNFLIVISDYLKTFYSNIFLAGKIFQIPILVDMDRFKDTLKTNSFIDKTFTYIGYMGGNKDGLEDLLDAFAIVRKRMSKVRLNLAGTAEEADLNRIKEKINQLELSNDVYLPGQVESNEIPILLANSDILVLARPDTNQAKAGFPTKLGEYLASKRPVVITKTGEIPKYLEDRKSAYLVEPGNIHEFAEKMLLAINDPEAKNIAENGYKIAAKNFDYKLYGNKIKEIFNHSK